MRYKDLNVEPETVPAARGAARRLVGTYAELASREEHLFAGLLGGLAPMQWKHFAKDDAIDVASGYQWFYHSHSPEDRGSSAEHGHIHVFARRRLWSRRMLSHAERAFARLCGNPEANVQTRHLLSIGFNAKGIPVSIFTVNSWVTGDLMLSSTLTAHLLTSIKPATGHVHVDAIIESVVALCPTEIGELMVQRDETLIHSGRRQKLRDRSLEVLSSSHIDLDAKIRAL